MMMLEQAPGRLAAVTLLLVVGTGSYIEAKWSA